MAKKRTPNRHRSRPPHRPTTSRESIEGFLRELDHHKSITLWGDEARDVLKLALWTFSDFATSGADLDEELCAIDDVLRDAGYDPESGAVDALRLLVRRVKRTAQTIPRPRRKARR